MTKAIILAAGKGSRLRGYHNRPKCLLAFGNKKTTIIERLCKILNKKKITKIIVITGFKNKLIKETLGKKVKYIYSKNFNKSNNLQSLLAAKRELKGEIICFFSDLIFDERIIKSILNKKVDFCLTVDTGKVLKDTMRIKIKKNKIMSIGSHIKTSEGHGNFIGISKFSKKGSQLLKKYLISSKNNMKDYYTVVFNKMIDDDKDIRYFDCKKFFWKEIDTYRDLYNMNKIIKKKRFKY
tara:strand:- start:7 stop:720 length:714 start_codon:yes stop_codon:yes gene_type:complete